MPNTRRRPMRSDSLPQSGSITIMIADATMTADKADCRVMAVCW